ETLSNKSTLAASAKEESFLNWNEVLNKFKKTFGNDVYESWIKNINLKRNIITMLYCLPLPDL
ncbi:hypothetical protein OAJ18_02405, partial [Pelagibacteraceae bacterium]|nr:hypothetical protein [Pelagibacteraceae bacterium]MDC0059848.1 hypothetical protein [Pelagibacteraceae bacterium]